MSRKVQRQFKGTICVPKAYQLDHPWVFKQNGKRVILRDAYEGHSDSLIWVTHSQPILKIFLRDLEEM
jgi:hypothetical protein